MLEHFKSTQAWGIMQNRDCPHNMYNMLKYYLLLSMIISVTSAASLGSRTLKCDLGWYYDTVIGRCDTCDSICDHAEIQGTVHDCLNNCPGFISGPAVNAAPPVTTTTPPSSQCDSERRTVTILLIALCGVTFLLVVVICTVMCLVFGRYITFNNTSTDSHLPVTEPLVNNTEHMLTHTQKQRCENYFPDRRETNNKTVINPTDVI